MSLPSIAFTSVIFKMCRTFGRRRGMGRTGMRCTDQFKA